MGAEAGSEIEGEAGGSTSLVSYKRIAPLAVERCPRVDLDVLALEEPDLRFPMMCKTWRCKVCGPRKSREKAAVMAWARPERFVTLTLAPGDWQACRLRVGHLLEDVRGDGFNWQMAWTVERGTVREDLHHIHGVQHGDYVPQRELQRRWGARVDIRAIKGARKAVGYAMKEALAVVGYSLKGGRDLEQHLDLNGGRGVHMTRGYLHGRRTDEVLEELRWRVGGREYTWVVVHRNSELVGVRRHAQEIPPEMALSSMTAR
jgi:hypothetical protein